jgi:hypothetical protein
VGLRYSHYMTKRDDTYQPIANVNVPRVPPLRETLKAMHELDQPITTYNPSKRLLMEPEALRRMLDAMK